MDPTGPSTIVSKGLQALSGLGQAIVAARGSGFSTNLLGVVALGRDGNEEVISLDQCGCHIHIQWEMARGFSVTTEDVGYGPEPVVSLVDGSGEALLRFFYPRISMKKVKGALKGIL